MHKNLIIVLLFFLALWSCNDLSRSDSASPDFGNGGNTGKAGSMARFAISGNRLYIVDNSNMRLFNIADEKNPTFENKIPLRQGVETVFPYGNLLFLGTSSGMDIYDLSNPINPTYISTYTHITGCDPVVVQGRYAYVTLRNGRTCGAAPNTLDVVDVGNIYSPTIVSNNPMSNPHGLGVERDLLFVCEGSFGFKTFNLSDPRYPSLAQNINTHDAFDLITNNGILMVVGKNGLYQYSYDRNPNNPNVQLLSKIMVGS